jgi:hypothetical protein
MPSCAKHEGGRDQITVIAVIFARYMLRFQTGGDDKQNSTAGQKPARLIPSNNLTYSQ